MTDTAGRSGRRRRGVLRTIRLLVAAGVATGAIWLAAAPPATSTVAPGAVGLP
jgi:hypothetical protein